MLVFVLDHNNIVIQKVSKNNICVLNTMFFYRISESQNNSRKISEIIFLYKFLSFSTEFQNCEKVSEIIFLYKFLGFLTDF